MRIIRIRSVMLVAAAASCAGFAQLAPDQPHGHGFEVASVKYAGPYNNDGAPVQRGGPGTPDPDRITCENIPMLAYLARAYGLDFGQISGPPWLSTEQYTVIATLPSGTTKDQLPEMWQGLLEERFHLAVHHAAKDLPIYELVIAKNGPRLKNSARNPGQPVAGSGRLLADRDGFPVLTPGVHQAVFQATVDGERVTRETFRDYSMEDLVKNLAWPLGCTEWEHVICTGHVVDKTGLTGKYDFTLEYAGVYYPGGAFPPPREDGQPSRAPSLFDAVQQQLGLQLREVKAPMDVLVVDHVDKIPTEN